MDVTVRGMVMLGLWGRYAGVSVEEFRRHGTFEFAHFFKEYIHLVDDQIDGGQGATKPKLPASKLKSDPLNRAAVRMLAESLVRRAGDRDKLAGAVRIIQDSRRRAFAAIEREQALGPFATAEEVIRYKEETTANTSYAMFRVMDLLHDVPVLRARRVEDAIVNAMMVMQVKDDLTDIAEDYGRNQNLVVGYLKAHPEEDGLVRGKIASDGRVELPWLAENAPKTFMDAYKLRGRYLSRVNPAGEPKLRIFEEVASYQYDHLYNIGDKDRVGPWKRITGGP
jgi:hypothetical protein